ncbi:LacI family DNA-binding transcriptional regulator [Nonomuraea sp. NPDC050404]|uniref:LacI family DNA-binding transcriptional regulator n=1 Tax=Nonomuraea sp. NPDC050404 TaxID=3155783 RepID=UPI003405216A
MAVTMHDVARAAGVSQRTVSNVVNGYEFVRPETRQRVLDAMAALGYVRNAAARNLRGSRTGLIALVVPNLVVRYFSVLANAVVREAEQYGYAVLVEQTGFDRERELIALGGGQNQLTDGAIMLAVALKAEDGERRRPDYPMVLVGDQTLDCPMHYVGLPNKEAALVAVRHLVGLGRRRLMLLGYSPHWHTTAQLRFAGFLEGLAEAGLEVSEQLLVESDWTPEGGQRAVEEFMDSGLPMPDAIFAMNDSLAIGALRGLNARGAQVPQQVAVVGFDNIEEARYGTPSLTTISPDVKALAGKAVAMLHAQISGDLDKRESHSVVDFRLEIRGSSR